MDPCRSRRRRRPRGMVTVSHKLPGEAPLAFNVRFRIDGKDWPAVLCRLLRMRDNVRRAAPKLEADASAAGRRQSVDQPPERCASATDLTIGAKAVCTNTEQADIHIERPVLVGAGTDTPKRYAGEPRHRLLGEGTQHEFPAPTRRCCCSSADVIERRPPVDRAAMPPRPPPWAPFGASFAVPQRVPGSMLAAISCTGRPRFHVEQLGFQRGCGPCRCTRWLLPSSQRIRSSKLAAGSTPDMSRLDRAKSYPLAPVRRRAAAAGARRPLPPTSCSALTATSHDCRRPHDSRCAPGWFHRRRPATSPSTGRYSRLHLDERAGAEWIAALSPEVAAAVEGLKAIVPAQRRRHLRDELPARAQEHDAARPDAELTVILSADSPSVTRPMRGGRRLRAGGAMVAHAGPGRTLTWSCARRGTALDGRGVLQHPPE